jgi:hypothetical protein
MSWLSDYLGGAADFFTQGPMALVRPNSNVARSAGRRLGFGQPTTSTIGGGANVQTSNMFNDWLQQMMSPGGSGGGGGRNGYDANGRPIANSPFQEAINQQQNFNPFNNPYNDRMQQYLGQMQGYLPDPNNLPQAPTYNDPNLAGYNEESGIYDQLFGQGGLGNIPGIDMDAIMRQFQGMGGGGGVGQQSTLADAFGAGGTGGLLNYDTNSPEFAALRQMQNQQSSQDVANLRARFTAGGGSSLGTGASLAEGQYLAQANPQNTLALGQLGRQMQEMDMANRGLNANVLLSQRGQNIDQRGQDNQAAIAGAQIGQQGQMALLDAMMRGQLGNQQSRLALAGLGADTLQGDWRNQFDARSQGNRDRLDASGMQNDFNLNNYNSQYGNMLGLGNLGLGLGGLGAQLGGMGLQGSQMQNQNWQNFMNQLFNSFNQSNQIGSPQAQTVQNPGAFDQLMKGAGAIAPFFGGPAGMAIGAGNMLTNSGNRPVLLQG